MRSRLYAYSREEKQSRSRAGETRTLAPSMSTALIAWNDGKACLTSPERET
eukprot:COSAG04_NODE_5249_length_1686_cov_2.172549_3_plen_50_part_01